MNFYYTNITILFADDAALAHKNYTEYLGRLFRNVYEADNGETAWELYKTHRPDIVLLDIEMPKLDGLTLARRIRQQDRLTRIIIATGFGNEARLLQSVELGLTRFLPKPFGRQVLKDALAKAVSELDIHSSILLGSDYTWDKDECTLYRGNEEIRLTARETSLMTLLASHPGQTVSLYDIEMCLWPEADCETDMTSRRKTLLKRLRKKLPEGCIQSIYGEGYRLVPR